MHTILVILAALIPEAIALLHIYKKDYDQPEPLKWLWKAFIFGVISVLLSLAFSIPAGALLGIELNSDVYSSIFHALADAFLLAAIPEELAKLIFLWLLLRKNPYFDEEFDGIVYAVCLGMGFAGIENIMYLADGIADGSWVSIGIIRALFSIPGHFLFAVLMGYYYSLYHFGINRSLKTKAMIIVAPILAHGIYDGIIMSIHTNGGIAIISMVLFLFFFNKLRKMGKERIDRLVSMKDISNRNEES